jgi:hypothetical protein
MRAALQVVRLQVWARESPLDHETVSFTEICVAELCHKDLAKPRTGSGQLPFDPLEYVEDLDELPFDRGLDPSIGR